MKKRKGDFIPRGAPWRRASAALLAILSAQGCNALLDNPEGHLISQVAGSGGSAAAGKTGNGGDGTTGAAGGELEGGRGSTTQGGLSATGARSAGGRSSTGGAIDSRGGSDPEGGAGGAAGETQGGSDHSEAGSGAGGTGKGGSANGGSSSGGSNSGGSNGGGSGKGGSSTGGTVATGGSGTGGGPTCGNGAIEGSEACDDQNTKAGDGCSQSCVVESGYLCSGAPSQCTRPSCVGLAKTCGPAGNAECCASNLVPGGTFNRGNSASSPATVSNFRLDLYEVTLGRMRKFVAAYGQGFRPSNGSGKNPNNAADSGWTGSTWNAQLPADVTALTTSLACSPSYQTWTTAVGTAVAESRPQNCMTWYVAHAFCIWDNGRLPTEAEWNYAAAGGAEQRLYPWSSVGPGGNANLAVYDCYYNGTGTCTGITNIAPVGLINAGNGRWGHADMAGNVWEWVRDYQSAYPTPCVDCATLSAPSSQPTIRGGSFQDDASTITTTFRGNDFPYRYPMGVRCARDP